MIQVLLFGLHVCMLRECEGARCSVCNVYVLGSGWGVVSDWIWTLTIL